MIATSLLINGEEVVHLLEPRESLVDVLRERCGLTATHIGCEHGACGACTVLVDDVPTRSCLKLAVTADGRAVQTLEGLRDDPVMMRLRHYFHHLHALQCGFCTPGMLITARDIVLRNRARDEAMIRKELSGQICRCTGYVGIVAAIRATAEERARDALQSATATNLAEAP